MRFIFLLGFLTVCSAASAQTAADYFHESANHYINSRMPKAIESAETGLKRYPNDVKLRTLRGKLKEEEEDPSKKKQDEDEQQNQDDKKQDDKQQNKQQQDEPKPDEQQQNGQPQSQPQQFSREEAEKILNSLKQDEKKTMQKYQVKRVGAVKIEKDW